MGMSAAEEAATTAEVGIQQEALEKKPDQEAKEILESVSPMLLEAIALMEKAMPREDGAPNHDIEAIREAHKQVMRIATTRLPIPDFRRETPATPEA